ncbi:MAG TPA: glycosyltransferase family A protein [Xanthobacteraceae bacterium]|jgi:glycosyltransferase involved in cell wall biosynthesis
MSNIPTRGPRLSVVMPNYNHGQVLGEALAAISRQTVPPCEVVVVDDGSTDDSVVRLRSLAADMPWLRLHLHPGNRGVNAACNTGLHLVSGDFVLFSAADDRLDIRTVERASAAVAAFPQTGIVFSDQAEMSADGANARTIPLDLPAARRYFSPSEFVRLMQSHFFYFHVSNVWFNAALLRELGGFPLDVRWHGDLLAAYAAAFERGGVYVPDAVSYVRLSPASYGAAGARSQAQADVLRAWLATTRQPGWQRRRAAFVAAAIWPDYRLRALPALLQDPGYISLRLVRRLAWLSLWEKLAPFFGASLRRRARTLRTRFRRRSWNTR